MTSHTTIRSWSAIAVGIGFTLLTAYVLLEDVFRHGAPITSRHVLTLATLLGSTYFGHRFWLEFSDRHIGNALGCAALFVAGVAFCVLSSAGRNAEVVTNKVLVANAANTGRDIAKRDMNEAKGRYDAAVEAEIKECRTGDGNLCRSARINTMVRRAQYDEAVAKLQGQKPEQVANSDIRAAAELLSRLPLVRADVDTLQATLLLMLPFLQSIFCEVAAIVGFSVGISHAYLPRSRLPAPESDARPARKARTTDEQMVLDALAKAGRPLSNEALAEALQISPGEATKRRQVCEAAGVVTVRKVGKYLEIAPATQH